jgi:hypothetical protein
MRRVFCSMEWTACNLIGDGVSAAATKSALLVRQSQTIVIP